MGSPGGGGPAGGAANGSLGDASEGFRWHPGKATAAIAAPMIRVRTGLICHLALIDRQFELTAASCDTVAPPGGRRPFRRADAAELPKAFSETHADLKLVGAGRDEMGACEGGQEVIQSHFVREIHDAEPDSHLRPVTVEQIVGSDTQIQEMPRRDARRVLHIISRPLRGDLQSRGAPTRRDSR